ncbi:endonuclease, partial [Arcobacter sp. CECT 8989]
EYKVWSKNYLWIGDNKNKGLAIFAKPEIKIEQLNWSDENHLYKNEKLESFIPCLINNSIILIAIWTKKANSEVFGYIGQLWKYLKLHKEKLANKEVIIIGDLNSNSIWDKWDRWWNHCDVVKELEELNIISMYHAITKEEQGKESTPTFYLQKKIDKPYHIDYCFLSKSFIDKKSTLKILDYKYWLEKSDHIPIVCEI